MELIKGVTFGYMSKRGEWQTDKARKSLQLLKTRCAINTVILPVVVEQDTILSTDINWQAKDVLSDQEVENMIDYAISLDLRVILKPMVNVSDGMWRAHINFFDHDAVCEPKWSDWFKSYEAFILHYAKIAQAKACEMLVIGCELVNANRREKEWRHLIYEVRKVYKGLITYNCDKYQEDAIQWWDAVDVISSSGYYPIDKWNQELKRIKKVVEESNKPFFFCEAGCPSRVGSEWLPNDWKYGGDVDLEVQDNWYQAMFKACENQDWIGGFGLWDWKANLYNESDANVDRDYAMFGKPAEKTIYKYYTTK